MLEFPDNPRFIFVYGTLRRNAATGTHPLLARQCDFHALGHIRGRLYDVDRYPGAIESGNPGETVIGEIYRIREPSGLLEVLDEHEESGPGFPDPHEYVRKILPVHPEDGCAVGCWVYVFNRDVSTLQRIDSGDYLEYLERSYGDGNRLALAHRGQA